MKRIAIIIGPYGSGKSEFCTQLALQRAPCAIADMDVINPYFRVRENHAMLQEHGIEVIDSILGHQLNQDIPAISGAIGQYVRDESKRLLIDLAGSEHGLKALRLFDEDLMHENYEVLLVMNPFRIEMSIKEVKEMVDLFQSSCNLVIGGIVNNANLLSETTWETIVDGRNKIIELSHAVGLPIKYTMIDQAFASLFAATFATEESHLVVVKQWMLREEWMGDEYA